MPSDSFNSPEDVKRPQESLTLVKQQVLQQLIEQLKTHLEMLIISRDDKREMARDAQSANQSHSDTSKFQLSNVQLGLESKRIETEETISILQQTPLNHCDKVTLGAIFTIREVSDKATEQTYFLVSAGGGETLTLGDVNVISVIPGAPITRACLQKNKGDNFEFRGKKFEITNIV